MKDSRIWDVANQSLEKGVTRVEASAGTGKTHNIVQMALRLILKEGLRLQDILIVTFTEAATSELRERVRTEILKRLGEEDLESERGRLENALCDFDQASIFTIHGFCQRTLRENAFESRMSFETELVGDPGPLQREVSQDFWRRYFYETSSLVVSVARIQKWEPNSLAKLLSRVTNQHYPKILPLVASQGIAGLVREWEKVWERIVKEWQHDSDKNLAALAKIKLDKETRERMGERMFLERIEDGFSFEDIRTVLKLGDQVNEEKASTPFMRACVSFVRYRDRFWAQICREYLDYAACEISSRRLKSGTQTYHDLLTQLAEALKGSSGEALVRAVRRRYKAALIDEFQDTDPLQYAIFRKIFDGPEHFLFLIGDPKQAIYGFRGADLFTYFEAGRSVRREFRLTHNWRSDAPLVAAVNTLFQLRSEPFVLPELKFYPVEAAPQKEKTPLRLENRDLEKPLRFIAMIAKDHKSLSGGEDLVEDHLVVEISQLLASGATLGETPLRPHDIAVLVSKNRQAEKLREKLRRHGIPSVLNTGRSVFESEEAWDMMLLLEAVLETGSESALKACMLSRCIGFTCEQLAEWERNDQDVRAWHERFFDHRRRWDEYGFMTMFRQFLQAEQVRPRILKLAKGERHLTNMLHLAELLHQAESELCLTPHHLLQWLRDRHAEPPSDVEGHELRLDTDDGALNIVTIHKSKGLEYPVVFCPYLWQKPHFEKEAPLYHDPRQNHQLTLDLLQHPEGNAIAKKEALAESVRCLYVAVTRAKNLCVVYWGPFHEAGKSPLGHLLELSTNSKIQKKRIGKSEDDFFESLNILEQASKGTINVTRVDSSQKYAPTPYHSLKDGLSDPVARKFSRVSLKSFSTTSFSGMISDRSDELTDRDPEGRSHPLQEPVPEGISSQSLLADFPRGVKAGDFFHEILERMDFQNQEDWEALISECLELHGWEPESLLEPVKRTLERLCRTPLGDRGGSELYHIGFNQRLCEVEFSFPIKSVTPSSLARLFRNDDGTGVRFSERLESLDFHIGDGFMQGVMDLVFEQNGKFYLIDWKTNWLGRMTEDYRSEAIRVAMNEHLYPLQYHLYVLALHLYLGKRLSGYDYEKHFGGIYYVFLRGVDPEIPGSGIFHDRPLRTLIEQLRDLLIRE